uniref:riboflavin kinase n=1 Tax=Myxine glutinosa TaxID=7769 RepID=UPI0035900CC6
MSQLLYRFHGIVVKGFGRGSKQLGIPTANLPESVVDQLPEGFPTGIYHGWANVGGGDVHKMVMSVGWNPFYNNTKKSMEVHIIHKFDEDFYGQDIRAVVLEYIRAERGSTLLMSSSQLYNLTSPWRQNG